MDSKEKNYSVREFISSTPEIRRDLFFRFDAFQGRNCCIIEDPITSQFFRVGIAEYNFIKKLNGKNSIGQALAQISEVSGLQSIDEHEAFQLVNWLMENQLIQTERSSAADILTTKKEDTHRKKLHTKLNPLFIRIPLFNPDSGLEFLKPIINFFFSKFFFLLWLLVISQAIVLAYNHWNQISVTSIQAILPNNWAWIFTTWFMLKLVHECFHAFACKKFGASVPEAGLTLILLAPMGYVDATSSWRLTSKWQRIVVAGAGMYIELFLAAVSLFIWLRTGPGFVNSFAYNTMITGSVVTIFFNANPLMRFDGYYIFSDILEIPNLYSQGQHRIFLYARKFLIGIQNIELPSLLDKEELIITIYGFCALFWRILVVLSLTITSAFILKGFGIILTLLATISWAWIPLYKFIKYLHSGNEHELPRPKQYCTRFAIILAIITLVALLPYSPAFTASAVVFNPEANVVRAECPGFIDEIFLQKENSVTEHETLMLLRNEDETTNLTNLKYDLQESQIKAEEHLSENETAKYQSELGKIESLKKQIAQAQKYIDTLTIKSPISGYGIPDPHEWKLGYYVDSGISLFTVLPIKTTEATLVINQLDAKEFQDRIGKTVLLKLKGVTTPIEGIIKRIVPQATINLPHPALSAVNGGPLPVLPPANNQKNHSPQLLVPHFIASMELINPANTMIREGQTGAVKFRTDNMRFIYQIAYEKVYNYIKQIITHAKQRKLGQ